EMAMGKKASWYKDAERTLYYVEKDLGERAQEQALEAARAVGSERLLDGRPEVIVPALKEAGLDWDMFKTLRLEGSSPGRHLPARGDAKPGETPRDVLSAMEPPPRTQWEESVP